MDKDTETKVNKENKTIVVKLPHKECAYTQEELIQNIKRLIKDFTSGKVQECSDYDYEEWCNPMNYYLSLLEKLLEKLKEK